MKEIKVFETHDVDLAAYLMLQGLKFIECRADETPGAKPRVIMRFFDEKEAALDLERAFMSSESYKYRSFLKYLLKDIHRTLRGFQ